MDKTYNPQAAEERHYEDWEKSGIQHADVGSNKPPYTIMMPPPNVTGSLHMGHALNMTLQDVMIRYHRMKGHDALWQPGTDHAGIATQMVVSRQLEAQGLHKDDLGRDAFIDKVWEWKAESGGTICHQLRKLGALPDWQRERFTMDDGLSDAVAKVFVQLHREGLIYRDKRLVNWDPKQHTALSDLEVSMLEKKGHMWHLKYPLADDPQQFITVATTRPETMLGDTAVAVHPDDERYQGLIGKMVALPLTGRQIPIIADDYADPEQGSGAVKITPAHDFNDYDVGKRNDLEMINILDRDAKINENAPEAYQGMDRFEARKKIIADFEELGLLDKIEEITHAVPFDEKSKSVVLEPWLTDQWYVDAETLAKPAIEAVEQGKTKFVPKHWENTYYEWMRNIQPWCISRQIWWGHRVPAWYGPDGAVFVEETEEEAKLAANAHYGKDVALTRDTDVLDTWFSSALWPFSTLGWPEKTEELDRYYPGDVLITGFDIIFFWVARMMMMGLHFMKEVPFHTVYIHALVRDEQGQKMSKTKGNIIDPLDLSGKYGADALRFTLMAMAAMGRDIKLAESRVEGYRNFATKLWNAARYAEMNEVKLPADFDPNAVQEPLNRWIIGASGNLVSDVAAAIEGYRFNEAANAIYQFVWGTFCDWYLEFTKPVLQGEDGAAKDETRATMGWVLDTVLHVLHPIMPSLTEELHTALGFADAENLIAASWPEMDGNLRDDDVMRRMDWIIALITEIRSLRADMNVAPGLQIPLIVKCGDDSVAGILEEQGALIERLARLSSITILPEGEAGPEGAIESVVAPASIFLPLADIIDIDAERSRLQKELDKLDIDLGKIDKKLANENFLAKAPEDVVDEQKARRESVLATKAKLADALGRLASL